MSFYKFEAITILVGEITIDTEVLATAITRPTNLPQLVRAAL